MGNVKVFGSENPPPRRGLRGWSTVSSRQQQLPQSALVELSAFFDGNPEPIDHQLRRFRSECHLNTPAPRIYGLQSLTETDPGTFEVTEVTLPFES